MIQCLWMVGNQKILPSRCPVIWKLLHIMPKQYPRPCLGLRNIYHILHPLRTATAQQLEHPISKYLCFYLKMQLTLSFDGRKGERFSLLKQGSIYPLFIYISDTPSPHGNLPQGVVYSRVVFRSPSSGTPQHTPTFTSQLSPSSILLPYKFTSLVVCLHLPP